MVCLWGVGLRQRVLWADEAGGDFGAGVLFSQGSNPVRGGWQSDSALCSVQEERV